MAQAAVIFGQQNAVRRPPRGSEHMLTCKLWCRLGPPPPQPDAPQPTRRGAAAVDRDACEFALRQVQANRSQGQAQQQSERTLVNCEPDHDVQLFDRESGLVHTGRILHKAGMYMQSGHVEATQIRSQSRLRKLMPIMCECGENYDAIDDTRDLEAWKFHNVQFNSLQELHVFDSASVDEHMAALIRDCTSVILAKDFDSQEAVIKLLQTGAYWVTRARDHQVQPHLECAWFHCRHCGFNMLRNATFRSHLLQYHKVNMQSASDTFRESVSFRAGQQYLRTSLD